MREQIKLLKNHAHFQPDFTDRFQIFFCGIDTVDRMKFNSVNNDFAILEIFEPIDAPDKRALSAAGRTNKSNDFAFFHIQADAFKKMMIAI